jgi:cell division protein FtsB
VQGDRGWFAMVRMKNEVQTAQRTVEQLEKDRLELERRTQLLRNDNMDPDLLDEKSRELLNYSKPGEIVVLTPQEQPANETKPQP